jgi:hypothetical protein
LDALGAVWRGRTPVVGPNAGSILAFGVGLAAVLELVIAAEYLPHADATTARAYEDLRPATAYLASTAAARRAAGDPSGRFLSISQTLFEVGDKAEMETVYGEALSAEALWAYMVSAKQREVLAPNLPLGFQVPAVDGYDGGLLPTQSYAAFSELLIPGGTLDGRLRENLQGIPDARWLWLLGVEFLLTDKTTDAWVDDVLYDRQFTVNLEEGQSLRIGWLPDQFQANGLSLIYQGSAGEVILRFAGGEEAAASLPQASTLSDGYRVRWSQPGLVEDIAVRATSGPLTVAAASLLDERVEAFYPLVLSETYRLVHSGDVKVYQSTAPNTGAWMVHQCALVGTLEESLDLMRQPGFDPRTTAVLVGASGALTDPCVPPASPLDGASDAVTVTQRGVGEPVIVVETSVPGYLVMNRAWYPGWIAELKPVSDGGLPFEDGASRQLSPVRADVLFQAVPIEPGNWEVSLRYRPTVLWIGAGITVLGLAGLLIYSRHYVVNRLEA